MQIFKKKQIFKFPKILVEKDFVKYKKCGKKDLFEIVSTQFL